MTTLDAARFRVWGTTAVVMTHPPRALADVVRLLREELSAVDAACSRFRDEAELARVNSAGGRWVTVSPLLVSFVQAALVAARQSDGAVDPTIGASLRLIGYDRDFDEIAQDGPPLRVYAERVPGWRLVEVDERNGRLRLPAGVQLDLGATAKALTADRAARAGAATTGAGVLVSLGGDLAIAGQPPAGGWEVRVTDDCSAPLEAPGQTVNLTGGALATSSTVVRTWKRGGESLHHIIDPATGRPTRGPWRTVSVAAASCVDANTAATAALVRGATAARWLEERGLPARLVANDGRVHSVAGWPAGQ